MTIPTVVATVLVGCGAPTSEQAIENNPTGPDAVTTPVHGVSAPSGGR